MNHDSAHLNSATAELVALSSTERIRAIETDRWVQYPRARQALAILNYVLRHPRSTRMPSVAIYGDSGMGKTMIMEKFRLDHPADFDPETGKARTPVLALQMSGKPNERRLYAQLLTALGAPHNPRATIVDLEQKAINLLKVADIKVLVIDEVHNLLSGSHREQRVVLNTLRFLSNELKMSLVCFGVAEAREAIHGDVQLARRFEAFLLPRWSTNEEFEDLVRSALRNLPLRLPSVLTAKSLRQILDVSDGLTAKIFLMLNALAVQAVVAGHERITDEAVSQ
jgi:Bacterial TniB protein